MKKTHSTFYLVCSTVLYTVCAALSIFSALLLGKIIDSASVGNMQELIYYIIFCAGLFVVYLVLSKLGIFLRMSYVRGKMISLKRESIRQILKMPVSLYREKNQAYYVNCLTADANKVEEQYYCSIPKIAFSICSFVCAVGVMIYVNYLLLLSYAVFFVVALLIPQILTGRLTKKQKESSKSNEEYMAAVKELAEGWETVKLNSSGQECFDKLVPQTEKNQKIRCSVRGLSAFITEVSDMSGAFSQLACIAFGGFLVTRGTISVGDLIIAIQLVQNAFSSISDVSDRLTQLNSVKPMAKKMVQMLPEEIETVWETAEEVQAQAPVVSYRNVSFQFEQKIILQDFNCILEKGKIYAIVGESGKGKSTIMRLLLKYYPDFSGEITFHGKSIREISDECLYSRIKYVSQDTYLFNDSIRNNVTMHREYGEDAFQKAVESARLGELISEYGEQAIGDFGNKISGGERQRISLARAMLQQPEMIIFDEPTSALDPKNTKEILDTIVGLEGLTRIVITHLWDEELFQKFDGVIRLT